MRESFKETNNDVYPEGLDIQINFGGWTKPELG